MKSGFFVRKSMPELFLQFMPNLFSKEHSDTVFNLIAQYNIKSAEQISFLHDTRNQKRNKIVLLNKSLKVFVISYLLSLADPGGRRRRPPPPTGSILLFSHTFSPKSVCVGGRRPPPPPPKGKSWIGH